MSWDWMPGRGGQALVADSEGVDAASAGKSWWEGVALWGSFLAMYGALVLLKLAWGLVIKLFASSYLVYYEGRFGKGKHSSAAAQSRQIGAVKKDN